MKAPDATPRPRHFASDNYAGICDEAWRALEAARCDHAPAYGDDPWTTRAANLIREVFETECEVFFVFGGTAANSLALASMCQSYHSIICHQIAHVETDECGAPEFFSNGTKMLVASGELGKLTAEGVDALVRKRSDVHYPKPRAVSLTEATEVGTVYTPDDLKRLWATCRRHDLRVHMDGARFANAVARLGCTPAALSWQAGVDVLSFGATKNGALGVEAVLFFDRALADDFLYRRKRSGQLVSKGRYLAAQMLAYLDGDRWLAHARHANAMADALAAGLRDVPTLRLPLPVQANAVFAVVPGWLHDALIARGARYLQWPGEGPGTDTVGEGETFIRLLTSFRTTAEDVQAFVAAAHAAAGATHRAAR